MYNNMKENIIPGEEAAIKILQNWGVSVVLPLIVNEDLNPGLILTPQQEKALALYFAIMYKVIPHAEDMSIQKSSYDPQDDNFF